MNKSSIGITGVLGNHMPHYTAWCLVMIGAKYQKIKNIIQRAIKSITGS